MKAHKICTQSIIVDTLKHENMAALSFVPVTNKKTERIVICSVILAHLVILALAITRTIQYKPLDIINPADNSSVEVTMVEAPRPAPLPVASSSQTTPHLLTADTSEREVANSTPTVNPIKHEVKPVIASKQRPIEKPKTHVKPKIAEKTRSENKPITSQDKPHPIQKAKVADKSALPATTSGPMLKSAPQAQPKMVSNVGCEVPAPDYPRRARRLQEEGQVFVRLVISANGTLSHSEIAKTSGFGDLDQAAIAAVSRIKCEPYLQHGQAISVVTIQPINFKISN